MLLLASTVAHSSFVVQSAPRVTQHHRVASAPSCTAVLDAPYREAEYDPEAADRFFRARPLVALRRAAEIAFLSAGFVGKVLADKQLGREEAMVDVRSEELLQLVTRLGVTAIKVGQVLSIRPDLLPAPYVKGLEKLQDSVQPFPAALGREIIERELSIRIEDVFSAFSAEPVAAASIGQVYRGTLRASGEEVAIKVQRPSVLHDVALDLFMLRFFAPAYQEANDVNTDVVGLVDAWGTGFVNELDYTMEAAATAEFAEAMAARGLGSVTSPEVVPSLSSTHVLTTKCGLRPERLASREERSVTPPPVDRWVEGERLASSNADDVPRLCGVALNAYLTMLLDTGEIARDRPRSPEIARHGRAPQRVISDPSRAISLGVLHCDPHPGNLLRTTDGRLCILDWGMTQRVPSDLQLSLLEFIANLNAEQYDRVPDDLVSLRFVPADKIGELRASGLTVAISKMLRLAAKGGGPAGAMRRMVEENKETYAAQLSQFDDLDSPEATKERQRLFREDWQREQAADALARGGGATAAAEATARSSTTADLTAKIEQLQSDNADVFAIPDYFVYMSRAFSTLEGIGLSSDSNYAILKECFPYLAKRLLSDDSPRARGALRTLLYGGGDELSLSRLTEVAGGLESYTSSTTSVSASTGVSDEGRKAAMEQLAAVLLSEDGNYVQSLLLKEAAGTLDATVRERLATATAPLRRLPRLPAPPAPLAPLARPLTLPLELASAALELQAVSQRDERKLENLRVLARIAGAAGAGGGGTAAGSKPAEGSKPAASTGVIVPTALARGGGLAPSSPRERAAGLQSRVEQLRWLATEASARRTALARTGVRFGSSLASAQAERLLALRRGKDEGHGGLSDLAAQLAEASATRLEDVAAAIDDFDRDLGARGEGTRPGERRRISRR